MAILPPKLYLKSSEENSSHLPSDFWKISAPSKNSLFWSLILSYVIYSEKNGIWKKGYELLLGNDSEIVNLMKRKKINLKPDPNSVKKQVLNFNPFRHQVSIFFNPNMTDILRMFDLRLNIFGKSMKPKGGQWDNTFKLKAASKMLECQIVLLTECSGANKVDYYGDPPKNGSQQLVIFLRKNVQKDDKLVDVYAFGMSVEHSAHLRRDALEHFLLKTDLRSDEILKIKTNVQCEENFLLFLLSSGWKHIIPHIYKSPYIAWKLADAGFNTDPCIRQNGLSAFSYCLSFENTLILQILYNYAVNNFQKFEESLRNPGKTICECLKEVRDSIKHDCNLDAFSNLGDRKNVAIKTSREILQLNEYQLCCVEEMCGILQTTGLIGVQRNQIVISVLNNYFKYFHYQTSSSISTSDLNLLENYIEYSDYYENLDNFTCLIYFDKVLSLNPVTHTENFSNVVLHLFITVLSYKMFPKCKHGNHCTVCQLTVVNCGLRFISYYHRNKLHEYGKQHLMELRNVQSTSVDPNETLQCIRLSLKDYPSITDEFLIKRLERYLKAAIVVDLDVEPIKGLLTIERAMQVIGETLHTTPDSKSVTGHLLSACFPNEIVHEFFNIRNQCLSHYRPNIMLGRINLENDTKRFKELQNALATLDHMLEPLYISQEFRTEEFLIRSTETECKKFSIDAYRNILKQRKLIQGVRKIVYERSKSKYKLLSEKVLDYIERLVLEKKKNNKSKNANEIMGAIESLKSLFFFIAQQCDNDLSQNIISYVQELHNELDKDEEINNQLKYDVIKNISKQREILSDIFSDTKSDKNLTGVNNSELRRYFEDVKKSTWFTDQEISDINNIVAKILQESKKAKEDLKKRLEINPSPSPEEVNKLIENLFTSIKNKETISTESQISPNKAVRLLGNLKDISATIVFQNLQDLTVFSEKEEGKDLLLRIKVSSTLENKMFQFLNRNLTCLLNRINHLKQILINEDDEIKSLWNYGKSSGIKKHTRFLMSQRYMREMNVRGSLEMLLFDCMNILISRKDLEDLWTKSTNMFSGVNLRDVLAHGSTVLQVVGNVLDSEDLPSQFIDKALELIEDGEALKELVDFWKKTKVHDLKQLEESISSFQGSKTSPQGKIQKCKRWKEYLSLLPLK